LEKADGGDRFAVEKDPLPELQIQQTPDTIAMIAMSSHVFIEQPTNGLSAKESSF
jgi:hypothetical protein